MKKILGVWLLVLVVLLTGCSKNKINDKVLVIGASASPHAEILEQVREYVTAQGYELQIKVYNDYVLPNIALQEGELDANFFQHLPYLNSFNEAQNTDLVSVYAVHYEPLGIYAGKSSSLTNIKDKATIAVPNDTTNYARALLLLTALGIIEVDQTKGLLITDKDITKNPYNIVIKPFEAAALPVQLVEVDYAVINGNYAVGASIPLSKLLATEDALSVAAATYGNIIAVKRGNENAEVIKVLIAALSQLQIKEYILSTYQGTVLPLQ
ncbi:MAG TPA: MetQ/NlpA family ABC transporter substrate-binding protein [Bacilli bacterium]|nr:MetQ/NlpA family ABC transporter substrate-binding protein [Bacilli bacterium]